MNSLTAIAGVVGGMLLAGTIVAAAWTGRRAVDDALVHSAALERRAKIALARRRKRVRLPEIDEPVQVSRLRRRATWLCRWAVLWRFGTVAGIVAGGFLFRIEVWLGAVVTFGVALAF